MVQDRQKSIVCIGMFLLTKYPFSTDMGFDVPFFTKQSKLFYNCVVNPVTNKTSWMYKKPDGNLASEMPQCNYLCDNDPLDDPKLYNRTWVSGTFTVGTKASYNCSGKDFQSPGYVNVSRRCL